MDRLRPQLNDIPRAPGSVGARGLFLLVGALLLAGCARRDADASDTTAAARSAAAVDSVLPLEEQARRFRLTLAERTDTLRSAAPTRDALVERFADALARFDTLALTRLVIDRAEFIDLYWAESPLRRPPYSMPPELLWMQFRNNGADGGVKLRHAFGPGGRPFRYLSYRCPEAPRIEGRNRLWGPCTVRHLTAAGVAEDRLFGAILERDGRFKFVTYANKL